MTPPDLVHTDAYTLGLRDIGRDDRALAGGKGAQLGELARIPGLLVPDGFCVTTRAFDRMLEEAPGLAEWLDRLAQLKPADREEIATLSAEIRRQIESVAIPGEIRREITQQLGRLGPERAYAIRSSATAEDLPAASFAGQQDTYLNILGEQAILQHISRCWASLFNERALLYRLQNDFGHSQVQLAVVVQQMVFPEASGILFTADPLSGHRKISSIDAGFGLGEALVSGLVNPDVYQVREGRVIQKQVAHKKLAIHARPEGGTAQETLQPAQQHQQVLSEEQILHLASLGREIEGHFGSPQDIEWCLAQNRLYILQSRPITTLFPIPEAGDSEPHAYISVGHQQMMTDAMKPLGLSFYLLTTSAPMRTAGGRLFVDVSLMLASAAGRQKLLDTIGQSEPLIRDALENLMAREDFIPLPAEEATAAKSEQAPLSIANPPAVELKPGLVLELIRRTQDSVAALRERIQAVSGKALFDLILQDLSELKQLLFDPQSYALIRASMDAAAWLNEHMQRWLGEKNAADTLTQSVPHNVTSEMGLALLEVADTIRPYPQVVDYLQAADSGDFLEDLSGLKGGQEVQQAITAFLDKYGMRCAGEIDLSKPRWSEKPATLAPLILGNIRNFEPGAAKRKFEQGQQEALQKEQELLARLQALPEGGEKARQTKAMIEQLRNFAGYREYPKYGMVSRYFIYKQALLREAARLLQAGLISELDDIYYLSFEELHQAVAGNHPLDQALIEARKEAYRLYQKLSPPRVITSEGEIISGTYQREDLPVGALPGLAVSAGVVEGRARVIHALDEAALEEGDILVTTFTDPSWTPLFVSIQGLVTEVGGLMTHGAVIAREYGLAAVVGVENATKLIREGQRIRVNGTDGFVELL